VTSGRGEAGPSTHGEAGEREVGAKRGAEEEKAAKGIGRPLAGPVCGVEVGHKFAQRVVKVGRGEGVCVGARGEEVMNVSMCAKGAEGREVPVTGGR